MPQNLTSVGETIMREHGLLARIILIYEDIANSLIDDEFHHKALERAARLVDDFFHDYHEEQEDRTIFPLLTKAGQHVELIRGLRVDHEKAKSITHELLKMSKLIELRDTSTANRLMDLIDRFATIYRRHSAIEATVILPALQTLVGDEAYMRMGQEMLAERADVFGEDAFEQMLGRIEKIEEEVSSGA